MPRSNRVGYGIDFLGERLRKRISRQKANEILAGILARAKEINMDKNLLWSIESIDVVGSYLTSAVDLSDVDISVKLKERFACSEREANEKRMVELGHKPRWNEEWNFGYVEVLKRLKNRRRYIHIIGPRDIEMLKMKAQRVFGKIR